MLTLRNLSLSLVALVLASACEDELARIYTARPYRVDADCLDTYVPIALVYAEELRPTCDPVCLLQDEQLYVSSVCAPYPDRAEVLTPEDSAECAAALAAQALDLACEEEASEADAGASDADGSEADAGEAETSASDAGAVP
jgi:hypothetical protein